MTNSERLSIYEWCDRNKDNVGAHKVVKNATHQDRRYMREGLLYRRDYVSMEVLPKETPTSTTRTIRFTIVEPQKQTEV